MKRLMMIAAVAALACDAFAAAPSAAKAAANDPELAAKREAARLRRAQRVVCPDSQKGVVKFVNTQSKVGNAPLEAAVQGLYKECKLKYEVCTGDPVTPATATAAMKKAGANLAVFVVSDPDLPVTVVAPEARWAIVNVDALAADGTGGAKLDTRVLRFVHRSFLAAAGAMHSQFPGNVLATDDLREIDALEEAFIPIDVQQKIDMALPKAGLTPLRVVRYSQACREGWAPAPTNDIQRTIWNETHELPKNPLKLEK